MAADRDSAQRVDRDYKAQLDKLGAELHQRYPDHPDRLAQLDAHLATVAMVIEHLADEEVRHKSTASGERRDTVTKAHLRATGAYVPDPED